MSPESKKRMQQYRNATATAAAVAEPPVETPVVEQQNTVDVADIQNRAICLTVTLGVVGNTRKVSASQVDVDADKTSVKVAKKLYDCDELKAIQSLDGEIRRFIYSKTTPNPWLRGGTYLLPIALVDEVHAKLSEFLLQRSALVDKFMDVYDQRVGEAKSRLRALYNAGDYPAAAVVRREFVLDWEYPDLKIGAAAGALEGINSEIYEAAKKKAAEKFTSAVDEVRTMLRASMAELVDHLVERLSGTEDDGKPKVFRNTLLTNVREFLDSFNARNIVDDKELDALVKKAKELTDGVEPDTLRKAPMVRDLVAKGFADIKTSLDAMMVDKPKRAITFD